MQTELNQMKQSTEDEENMFDHQLQDKEQQIQELQYELEDYTQMLLNAR